MQLHSPYIRRPAPARTSQDCLSLDWSFGLHRDFKSVIHNLSHGGSGTASAALSFSTINSNNSGTTGTAAAEQRRVFYPLAHVGVLYDAVGNTQQHLLGHAHTIVASCCSHNRRFVVTCDEGDSAVWGLRNSSTCNSSTDNDNSTTTPPLLSQQEDYLATAAEQEAAMVRDPAAARVTAEDDGSLMIIWDTSTGLPVRTIPIGQYGGVVSCAMSPDGLFIATLNRRTPQEVMVWGWTAETGEGDRGEDDRDAATTTTAAAALTADDMMPEYVRRIPAQDEQTCVRFSTEDPCMLCTNGLRRVLFWSWREGRLTYYSPPVIQGDWKVPIGSFTQTIFVPGTSMACSGTVDGDVVLWELQPRDRVMKEHDKTLLKMVRVHGGGGVTFLTSEGGYIVTGGMDGHIRFLDTKLRLVAWFEDLNGGPVISVSFDKPLAGVDDSIADTHDKAQRHLRAAGTAAATEFASPDFMISTANAMIIDVPSRAFHAGDRNLLRGKLLVQGQDQAIEAVAAHPKLSRIAVGGYSGNVHLWDYQQRRVLLLSIFRNLLVQSLAFDPTGTYLVAGFTNGVVKVLDAETLVDKQTFRPKRPDNAVKLVFSPDGRMLAVGTASGCIGLYELRQPRNTVSPSAAAAAARAGTTATVATALVWEFTGNHKTHKAPISGLQFQVNISGEAVRLLSVGEDKRLIEYNLVESDAEAGLLLRTAHKITQGALPTGFVWSKNVAILDDRSRPREAFGQLNVAMFSGANADRDNNDDDDENDSDDTTSNGFGSALGAVPLEEDYLLVATNEYKISAYLSDWSRQCIKTVLAPTFGGPVTSLMIAPGIPFEAHRERAAAAAAAAAATANGITNHDIPPPAGTAGTGIRHGSSCLVYATREKVVGLMQLPLRGDPCASMGLLAHPGLITCATLSHDGQFLFTAGGDDQCVMQWRIDGRKIMPSSCTSGEQTTSAEGGCTEGVMVPEDFAATAIGGSAKSRASNALLASAQDSSSSKRKKRKKNSGSATDIIDNNRDSDDGVPLSHLVAAVEGGSGGELMREVIDYFYYAQIRAQGEETTAKRELLGAVHFSQMPNLLRALGYYPTELDIGHLTFEVANALGPRDEPLAGVDVDDILLDFTQFMRLYVNHRPVFGITRQAIEAAFATIGADPQTRQIARDAFFELLSTKGEPLHSAEITAALTSLLGDGVRVDMLEDRISARAFAENLLGFEDYDGDLKGAGGGGGAGGLGGDGADGGDDDDDESSYGGEVEEGVW